MQTVRGSSKPREFKQERKVNYLYLDIETIPCQDTDVRKQIVENLEPPSNYKKQETIDAWLAENTQKAIDQTSFDGALGEICCIGFWHHDSNSPNSYTRDGHWNESEILISFIDLIKAVHSIPPTIVGHYVSDFDLRFIRQRCIVHGIKLPRWFPKDPKPWSNEVFDTNHAWAGAKGNIKLDKLAKALNIKGKSGMDGSQVARLWDEGKYSEIAKYCQDDVRIVKEIHEKMQRAGL